MIWNHLAGHISVTAHIPVSIVHFTASHLEWYKLKSFLVSRALCEEGINNFNIDTYKIYLCIHVDQAAWMLIYSDLVSHQQRGPEFKLILFLD